MVRILTLVILLFVGVAFLLVYYSIYKKRINESLHNPANSKRMIPPFKVLAMAVVGLLIGYIIIGLILPANSQRMEEKYYNATYDFKAFSSDEIQGYLTQYSMDENEGYTKYEENIEDTHFTYFIREDEYDIYHPTFIIFGEYIGDKDIQYYDYEGTFLDDKIETICGLGIGGPEYEEYFMVIGNVNVDCYFQFNVYYFDGEMKYSYGNDEIELGDNADEKASITIRIP